MAEETKAVETEVAEATEEKATPKKTTTRKSTAKKTTTSAPERKTRAELKKTVNRDMEVIVMNNTSGIFTYTCPKSKLDYRMGEFGDTEIMTVEELMTMKSKHKGILSNYWLVPIEVVEEGVTLDDVLAFTGLDRVMNKQVLLDEGKLDDFIIKQPLAQFEGTLRKFDKQYQAVVVERALTLFKQKEFADYNKMKVIMDITGNEHIFEDVSE